MRHPFAPPSTSFSECCRPLDEGIPMPPPTAEHARLDEIRNDTSGWRRWGPYVSERSWGTVREDYSADGNAWKHLTHDLARSVAYRWGEDGIAGICDRFQLLCFAPAFWNSRDPILKERLFGLDPFEGNHGEDVKEYYFHLDNVPSHAYMRYLYKYPQAEFPYSRLVQENQARGGRGLEYELLDTGVFTHNAYFDIVIEYAKVTPDDLVVRIEAINRGRAPARLDILPHLWYRNNWGWKSLPRPAPRIRVAADDPCTLTLAADRHELGPGIKTPFEYHLGPRTLYSPPGGVCLFTENETNPARFPARARPHGSPYVKDAFHRHIIRGERCTNPALVGSKAAIRYQFASIPPGESAVVRLRLSDQPALDAPLDDVDAVIARRRAEADEFYAAIHPADANADERNIQRQAFAGVLWNKQAYLFDVQAWLAGDDPDYPPPPGRPAIRNDHWRHLNSMRVLSLPDKWEYPWFAAWDLAFQAVALAVVDPALAMDQLWYLLFEQFQHPNGQLPAYEWEFSDLNPPVHAWAVWRVYNMARIRTGTANRDFLEKCFHKLLINFTWWINKVDHDGNNIFEGGFLGMDNITVVDRSTPCGDGAVIEQSDACGWMSLFCLNLMRIALELAKENRVYEGLATKFFQHYAYIAAAMKKMGGREYALWDDKDGFFYDVLRARSGHFVKLRVRSMVGLIPLFAVERLERDWIAPFQEFTRNVDWFLAARRDLVEGVVHTVTRDGKTTHVLTIVDPSQLTRIIQRLWDPSEFLADFGIRSLSKAHGPQPFVYDGRDVGYEPAESVSKIKGGNSNWRGPIWFPTCFLLIESFRKLAKAFGTDFRVPTRGGGSITFPELASQTAERLIRIFARDGGDRRPVYGGTHIFQEDPHWRDLILFYEYFHGDNGAGLGASHQAGWTALVANLIDEWRKPSG
jgi:hypothetical protein